MKLLIFGESLLAMTGHARVAREIAEAGLARGWEITQVAFNHIGTSTSYGRAQIIPAQLSKSDSVYGEDLAYAEYLNGDYDLMLIVQDLEVGTYWGHELSILRDQRVLAGLNYCPIVYYFPVDGPQRYDMDLVIKADLIITHTRWGRNLIRDLIPDETYERLQVIPHGTDVDLFCPVSDTERTKARRDIFFCDDDTFVISCVNRNSARKDLFQALQTVAELKKRDVIARPLLYVHSLILDNGIDLHIQADALRLRIKRDILFAAPDRLQWPDTKLNNVYAASDCMLVTARRESWGLTVTEAMAAGCPVVAPDYGPFAQHLGDGRGYLHSPAGLVWTALDNRGPGWMTNPVAAAEQIEQLYLSNFNPEPAHRYVESATWSAVGEIWADLLEQTVDGIQET